MFKSLISRFYQNLIPAAMVAVAMFFGYVLSRILACSYVCIWLDLVVVFTKISAPFYKLK